MAKEGCTASRLTTFGSEETIGKQNAKPATESGRGGWVVVEEE
jgi:hypothetical protein